MSTIEKLFGIAGASVPAPVRQRTHDLEDAYPAASSNYVFPGIFLKKMLRFFAGNPARKNLLLMGEPGVGKSSVILEIAARLNIPVFALACSGKTRFAHMVGGYEFVSGETRWRDGPLVRAMRTGGIFLANEVTRLDAGEQMNLAEVLDSGACITIPDTGEVVKAHPDFRFIATGNSGGYGDETGAFSGEKVSSVAFLDRFQKIEVHHLSPEEETDLLRKSVPSLPESVIKAMVKLAGDVRRSFVGRGGNLRTILSTRSLVVWALEAADYAKIKGIQDPMQEALCDTVLGGCPEADRTAILEIWTKWVQEGA